MAKKGAQNVDAFTLSKTTRRVLKDKKTQYTGDPNNRYLKYSTIQIAYTILFTIQMPAI